MSRHLAVQIYGLWDIYCTVHENSRSSWYKMKAVFLFRVRMPNVWTEKFKALQASPVPNCQLVACPKSAGRKEKGMAHPLDDRLALYPGLQEKS